MRLVLLTNEGAKLEATEEIPSIRSFIIVPENEKEKRLLKNMDGRAFTALHYDRVLEWDEASKEKIDKDILEGLTLSSCMIAATDYSLQPIKEMPLPKDSVGCSRECLLQKMVSVFEKVMPEIFSVEFGLPFCLPTIAPTLRVGATGLGKATGMGFPNDEVWFLIGCTKAGLLVALESFDDLEENDLDVQREILGHKVGWRVDKEGKIGGILINHWEGCNGVISISVAGDIEKKKGANQ